MSMHASPESRGVTHETRSETPPSRQACEAECQTVPMMSTQELLGLFECPVCYDYMLPPIYQCVQGHLICSVCKPKLVSCPSCREELGMIRCMVMEKVAETLLFPCRNASQGCEVVLHRAKKVAHEQEQCKFRLFDCPYKFIDNCMPWMGNAEKVLEHLYLTHLDNFEREHGQLEPHKGDAFIFTPYVCVIDYNASNNNTTWMWTAVQQCFDVTFVVNLYYLHNGCSNIHFLTVRMLDTVETAKKFWYRVELDGPNGSLAYQGRCHSLHEEVKEIYEHRDCLSFDSSTAQKFKTKVTRDGRRRQVLTFHITVKDSPPSSSHWPLSVWNHNHDHNCHVSP